jgi:putative AlgH/UPF0301 family transcriptional regulator
MLHFAQLAAGRISLLTLDMHTLHSTTTTSHHLRQASMLGGPVSATYQQHISNISATMHFCNCSSLGSSLKCTSRTAKDKTVQHLTAMLGVADLFFED